MAGMGLMIRKLSNPMLGWCVLVHMQRMVNSTELRSFS